MRFPEERSLLTYTKTPDSNVAEIVVDGKITDEEMNAAMNQLTETVGDDVPTFNEVQEKIEARYAKAKASAELQEVSVESRVLEIEQATANVEAQSRLSQLRSELGLDSGTQAAASGSELPAPEPESRPATS